VSELPPPPAWATEPAPPLTRRRKLLLLVAGALAVLLLVAGVALQAVLVSLASAPAGPSTIQADGAVLDDCAESYPDGFSERAAQEIVDFYGEDAAATMRPTGVPVGFPAAPFAWSGIVPVCGSAVVDAEGAPAVYLFYAEDVTRARFDGLAAMLTAAGAIMRDDRVPREPQSLPADQLSGVDPSGLDELLREFVIADVGVIWLTFETDDLVSPAGTGELIIEFTPQS
jgi:hypothetical protein